MPPKRKNPSSNSNRMTEVSLGQEVSCPARFIALWWNAHPLPARDNVDLELELSKAEVRKAPGVYAVTGHHDALGGPAVLYVGKGGKVAGRMKTSIHDWLFEPF